MLRREWNYRDMTLRGVIAVLLFVALIFAAPITVVNSLLSVNDHGLTVSEGFRNWGQALQGLATALALGIGGYWTYSVFIHGRSYTAHVQISTEFKHVIKATPTTHAAVISVQLKNGGRARIEMEECRVGIKYFDNADLEPLTETLLGTSLVAFSGNWERIFRNVEGLEPGEEYRRKVHRIRTASGVRCRSLARKSPAPQRPTKHAIGRKRTPAPMLSRYSRWRRHQ